MPRTTTLAAEMYRIRRIRFFLACDGRAISTIQHASVGPAGSGQSEQISQTACHGANLQERPVLQRFAAIARITRVESLTGDGMLVSQIRSVSRNLPSLPNSDNLTRAGAAGFAVTYEKIYCLAKAKYYHGSTAHRCD